MSRLAKFQTSRMDGRTDAQVIIDLLKDGEPGHIYSYDEITDALQTNSPKQYTIQLVRSAIYRSEARVLKELCRRLQNIAGVGYRLAFASDHQVIASAHKRRADRQMRRGLRTLRNVRWEEMDQETRTAHEGTLLIMSALHTNQRALERRQTKIEEVLQRLIDGAVAPTKAAE